MIIVNNVLYTKTHEWVKIIDLDRAIVGITDYAQSHLGSLVFVNLPEVGDELVQGESFADIESVKAVSDVFSPYNAVVEQINQDAIDFPERINEDPYGTWLAVIGNIPDLDDAPLMDYRQYEAYCAEEEQ